MKGFFGVLRFVQNFFCLAKILKVYESLFDDIQFEVYFGDLYFGYVLRTLRFAAMKNLNLKGVVANGKFFIRY